MGSIAQPSQLYFDGFEGYSIGKQTGAITSVASASSIQVYSASHGLSNGEKVTISGTTDYDGTELVVSNASLNTFTTTGTFTTSQTGTWTLYEGSGIDRVSAGKFWYYCVESDTLYVYVTTLNNDPNDDERIEMGRKRTLLLINN